MSFYFNTIYKYWTLNVNIFIILHHVAETHNFLTQHCPWVGQSIIVTTRWWFGFDIQSNWILVAIRKCFSVLAALIKAIFFIHCA